MCVQISNSITIDLDNYLESVGIGPRADGPFEEGGNILEGGKLVVLRMRRNMFGISKNSPLLDRLNSTKFAKLVHHFKQRNCLYAVRT